MAKVIRGKKGIFFTFIAITIVTLFILLYTPQSDISLQKDKQSVTARISSVDEYVSELEGSYFETALKSSGFKAVQSLIFYMNKTGKFLNELDPVFYEVMLNGTIGNIPIDSITGKAIMEDNTLRNWSDKISQAAKDTLNVNTTITFINASVRSVTSKEIEPQLVFNIAVKSSVADWNKNAIVSTRFSIEGFYDPYYLVNTNGEYTNQITVSNVEFNGWNSSIVREHLRNGTYVHWVSSNAPDFLGRFTNSTANSSCCGIESFVNPTKISPSDTYEDYVDYLYWGHAFLNNCTVLYNITGLWDEFMYFKLDFDSVLLYNISLSEAIKTC